MKRAFTHHRRERIWLLSPAAVTALFVLAQLYLNIGVRNAASPVAGAATDGPTSGAVQVRVVAEIRPVTPRADATDIPETEAEFWALLRRDGQVMFFSDEVEVVTTPAQRFDVDEVDVIEVKGARGKAANAPPADHASGSRSD